MIWFNAAGVTGSHTSISINDSKQKCFGVTHILIMNYVQVDKHLLGSSRDINRVVGDEVLRCESAMDMTGLWTLKGNAFPFPINTERCLVMGSML